jgi:uncharacterized protein
MIARLHAGIDDIAPDAWDALRPDDNPFLAHAFLAGLERHDCIRADVGWKACPLGLYDDDRLVAAAPLYLKGNSHGEFVFDWSWAQAYERSGLAYYPKLLCAVPYSPVGGPRLLAGRDDAGGARRDALIAAIEQHCAQLKLSSAHVNFLPADDALACAERGWLRRSDWQFHWTNAGYRDFDGFLAALTAKKRKNVRQERAQVARSGVELHCVDGAGIDGVDWDFVHACYAATFADKGNHPALTVEFFRHLGARMRDNVVVVIATLDGANVASALMLRSATTLYGRYWGALRHVAGLHFEACYYQGIEYCIRHGLARFEPGAQGEHKLARGFLPYRTHSVHLLRDGRFRNAVRDALAHEARALDAYGEELMHHSPYAER